MEVCVWESGKEDGQERPGKNGRFYFRGIKKPGCQQFWPLLWLRLILCRRRRCLWGSGGYFEDESGSLSTGADARKASNSDIQRTKWVQSFSELEEDDEGVFTNLRLAAKEAEEDGQEAVWENIVRQIKMRIRTMTLFLPGGIIPEARDRFWSATGRRFTGMLPWLRSGTVRIRLKGNWLRIISWPRLA